MPRPSRAGGGVLAGSGGRGPQHVTEPRCPQQLDGCEGPGCSLGAKFPLAGGTVCGELARAVVGSL